MIKLNSIFCFSFYATGALVNEYCAKYSELDSQWGVSALKMLRDMDTKLQPIVLDLNL